LIEKFNYSRHPEYNKIFWKIFIDSGKIRCCVTTMHAKTTNSKSSPACYELHWLHELSCLVLMSRYLFWKKYFKFRYCILCGMLSGVFVCGFELADIPHPLSVELREESVWIFDYVNA
jgi:hypothetical protein